MGMVSEGKFIILEWGRNGSPGHSRILVFAGGVPGKRCKFANKSHFFIFHPGTNGLARKIMTHPQGR
jgi:hypothetical protein